MVIIVAVAVVFFGGVFVWQYYFVKSSKIENSAISADQTAGPALSEVEGWKTYTNSEYGFEIKYPEDFDFIAIGILDGIKGNIPFDPYVADVKNTIEKNKKENIESEIMGALRIYKDYTISGRKALTYEGVGSPLRVPSIETIIKLNNSDTIQIFVYDRKGNENIDMQKIITNDFSAYKVLENLNDHILSTFKFIDQFGRPLPRINNISPASGSTGTEIEVRGQNLCGFESDRDIRIENSNGVSGIIYGNPSSTCSLIRFTLPESACQQDTSYSGLPCPATISFTPGNYKVYTSPWGNKSNVVNFEITVADFPFTMHDTYVHAKQVLAENGWMVDNIIDFKSVGDSEFPEIGDCGIGIDAICHVNFKKGDKRVHLNVQIGGRAPYGPYSEWTVVGNE